jgi:hypothetical protein
MRTLRCVCGMLVLSATLAGCASTSKTMEGRGTLHDDVLNAITEFKQSDPALQQHFDTAYAYAVFPSVGWTIGESGAFGRGEVYEKGKWAGTCSVTQARVGTPLNGKSYSELIFFKDAAALNSFESNEMAFDAEASAVVASKSGAAGADYRNGVLVFTKATDGLAVKPTIRGQEFNFDSYYDMHSANVEP